MPSLETKLFVMQLRSYLESFKTLNLDPFFVSRLKHLFMGQNLIRFKILVRTLLLPVLKMNP